MAYDGWMRFGGLEVVNTTRAAGYARTSDCPLGWVSTRGAAGLLPTVQALFPEEADDSYDYGNVSQAPWYDLSNPDVSGRFYGVIGLGVKGLGDTTVTGQVTEGLDDGGVIGLLRKNVREVTYSVYLIGRGQDALDYGIAWLSSELSATACGQHGSACGTTDLEFLTAAPRSPDEDGVDVDATSRSLRYLHDVAVTSGPLEGDLDSDGVFWGQEFEFTVTAERPYIYSALRTPDLPVATSQVVQDIAYNLVASPSAEERGAHRPIIGINGATNPSLESSDTGWSGAAASVVGDAPVIDKGRVKDELQASGDYSYRVHHAAQTPSTEGASAMLSAVAEVKVISSALNSSFPNPSHVSLTIWGALVVTAGADETTLTKLSAVVGWSAQGLHLPTVTDLGEITDPSAMGGAVFAQAHVPIPEGADTAAFQITGEYEWGATTDVRLYADAVALTVP